MSGSWLESLVWGAPQWRLPVVVIGLVSLLVLVAAYLSTPGRASVRLLAASLKTVAIAALLVCLLEPLLRDERPRAGANLFVVLADNSRSLALQDADGRSLQQQMQQLLKSEEWQTRLGQDFDVRRYVYDARLRSVADWRTIDQQGGSSALGLALQGLVERFQGQPLAGVLLLSDGVATDDTSPLLAGEVKLPPVYPVLFDRGAAAADVAIQRLSVRQTNFEESPVTVTADVTSQGFDGPLVAELRNQQDELLARKVVTPSDNGSAAVELRVRPDSAGVHFYHLRVVAQSEAEQKTTREATRANNERLVLVHRHRGPYRLLYVSGRPNWEFKYLRRATEEDAEVELVGILRIAHKEPKFVFRDRAGTENPFFRGFDAQAEDVEQYDQPVLVRIGVDDPQELRDGFPKGSDELYGYHAVILDDLEAKFFTQDQLSLLQKFVSQRGGGLLMLGGESSFVSGDYHRTPVGEMLPVYLDGARPPVLPGSEYRLELTRDGWLQPWIRMRANETDERRRLAEMPAFATLNRIRRIKPGATVLAQASIEAPGAEAQASVPALVAQRYGKGRAAAVLIGDMWRWAMRREVDQRRDLEKAWRQTLRWLVSDVPHRVEAQTRRQAGSEDMQIRIHVRDKSYEPLDNAELKVLVHTPDDREVEVRAREADEAGIYEATFTPGQGGAYHVTVEATDPGGQPVGSAETGWAAEPAAEEFASLEPDEQLLRSLAQQTAGEAAAADRIESFVAGLSRRKAVINEPWMRPLWHRWYIFLLAGLCLAAEWGVRRWNGLP